MEPKSEIQPPTEVHMGLEFNQQQDPGGSYMTVTDLRTWPNTAHCSGWSQC